jgi:hypothetical protein
VEPEAVNKVELPQPAAPEAVNKVELPLLVVPEAVNKLELPQPAAPEAVQQEPQVEAGEAREAVPSSPSPHGLLVHTLWGHRSPVVVSHSPRP